MSTIPIWGNLSVDGDVTLDSNKFITGDVRPVSPAIHDSSGSYVLDSFSSSKYRSAEYLIQVSQGADFLVTRVLILHNDSFAYLTEYGRIETAPLGVEFDVVLSGGIVSLSYTQPSINTVVKAIGTCLNP
jgi:hypothetical protein